MLLTDNLQFYTTNWFKILWEYFIRIRACFYLLNIQKYYNNKKDIFNKSFFPEKSRTQIKKVNITFVFQEFYTRILFAFITFLSFLVNLKKSLNFKPYIVGSVTKYFLFVFLHSFFFLFNFNERHPLKCSLS